MTEQRVDISSDKRKREIYKATIIGSICNLLLLVFKFVAGIVGHSAAMVADAVHSMSDFATDIIILLCVRISGKPQDKDHDYGHGKYETLATVVVGLILFGVGLGILWNGVEKIWLSINGVQLEEPGILAFIAAIVSILIKEALCRYTAFVGKESGSQTLVANAWHHRSDALSSIGTAVGIGGAILLGPSWRLLDPLAAVVVSGFIIRVAYKLIVPCIDELMEKSLPDDIKQEIEREVSAIPGVFDPHNLRTRKIGNGYAVNVHVRMDAGLTVAQSHEITREIEHTIRRILGGNAFVYVHVEPKK